MRSIDPFFNRTYSKEYTCLHFACEVWEALTGEVIRERLISPVADGAPDQLNPRGMRGFKRLESPVNPCLVLFQRKGFPPHVGIYLDRRILHLHKRGVEFQPLCVAQDMFSTIGYYR